MSISLYFLATRRLHLPTLPERQVVGQQEGFESR
jgi:hypothetical protein